VISVISYCLFALLVVGAMMVKRRVPRQLMLLSASYLFYSVWGLAFLAILVSSSLFNFFYGEFLKRRPSLARLTGGVAANVLLLAFFKGTLLAIFVNSHAMDALRGIGMPLGISFWTFQALSYLFDIYREEELDPTPVEFCLYMAFWPTVVMGPICRLGNMLPQFREVRVVSSENVLIGSKRILMGLVMKLGISQILAVGLVAGTGVSAAFDQQSVPYGGLDVWFLAIGYGLQLFFDFAGYSHIVIGAARLFGFELAENFNSPFIASTPSEFWTRWHMTLTSWIRDYVFVPMATLRRDVWWRYAALLFSMTLFGLWHGAKATFILWGVYEGALLVIHRMVQQFRRNRSVNLPVPLDGALSWLVTFLAVSLGWIFFRSRDLGQAMNMLGSTLSPGSYLHPVLPASYFFLVSAVFIAYIAHKTILAPTLARLKEATTPAASQRLAEFGLTGQFVTVVSLIPLIFVLFLSILHNGSESVTPFVYALF
jgi:alginate O-acetyltransferase complex protein AlgI